MSDFETAPSATREEINAIKAGILAMAGSPASDLTIVRAVQTCEACPSQWHAWTADGQYLYLRYRSGIGTADSYDTPNYETWTRIPDGNVARFGEPSLDGEIDLAEFCARAGLTIADGADLR